jgi:hypothetical protein
MKSGQIISNNQYVTVDNQKYVTVHQYNDLQSDFTTLLTNIGFDTTIANTGSAPILTATGTLTATQIVGSAAGSLAHANGVELVAAPGAGYVYEFLSAVLILDFDTAAYTGGGTDLTIRVGTVSTCAALTTASLVGAAADAIEGINALATNIALTANTNINLKCTSAFTQPGTAAGKVYYKVTYRVHATGL